MASEEVYLGTWRIVECVSLAGTVETTGIEGTEFILEEGGDVSWKVSDDAELLPFFNCETYEVVPDKNYSIRSIKFIGTYAGLEANFKVEVSDDLMLLTYERCCMLQCQKVSPPDPKDDIPFSFIGALEEGYFADIVIRSESGKEYKAHSTILSLASPNIDWTKSQTPLNGLPDDVLQTTLHFMYSECLPRGLSEETAHNCMKIMSKMQELPNFVKLCDTFLKNTALRQQITSLVTDMHASTDKVIEMFSGVSGGEDGSSQTDSSIMTNPAKLCYVVKQSLREAAVAFSKLLILCDLYSRRKSELSREERHDIIKYAKSRIPVFTKQWDHFLEICKAHTSNLSADQCHEIATYLVSEIESGLEIISTLVSDSKAALEQIILGSEAEKAEKQEKSKKGHVGDVLGKALKNALHVRELKKLKKLHDRSQTSFFNFMQHKDNFSQMSHGAKVRSISRLLEQLADIVLMAQGKQQALLEDLPLSEWKYFFKLGTSKISWAICKLLSNKEMIQPLVKQACDMVHREQFTASVTSLGLLDMESEKQQHPPGGASTSSGSQSCPKTGSQIPPKKTKYVQLSSVESLCIPPYARDSHMAQTSIKLLHSQKYSDFIFEIILTHDTGDTVIDHTSGEPVVKTETEQEIEIHEIPAHRVVIATRCDWFKRALLSGMREAIDRLSKGHGTSIIHLVKELRMKAELQKNCEEQEIFLFECSVPFVLNGRKITIHDTNPDLFKMFLEYLYCGQLDTNEMATEQLADMMTLADRYDTVSLRSRCEHALKHHIDDDTVFYLLSLGDQLSTKTLKDACLSYISEHPHLATNEVYQEIPEHLQVEIESYYMTLDFQPRNSSHSWETPSSISSTSEIDEMVNNMEIADRMNIESGGTSSSSEDMASLADSSQLESCVETIQGIVGDTIPHDELVRAALAADCDANRALNFLFS